MGSVNQEYTDTQSGKLCARLIEKKTGKRVVFVSKDPMLKQHLLSFLAKAKIRQDIMPTIFDSNGSDIVAAYGVCVKETDIELELNPDVESGGFRFE